MFQEKVKANCGILIVIVIACVTGIVLLACLKGDGSDFERTEQAVEDYLVRLEPKILAHKTREAELYWAYLIDNNEETLKCRKEGALKNAKFFKEVANELRKYNYNSFQNVDLKRRIKKLSYLGYAALNEEKFKQHTDLVQRIRWDIPNAKVCEYQNNSNCNLSLKPKLNERLAKSRNPEELKYYWVQWHDVTGKPVRKDFEEYVKLNREAASLNNFTSGVEYWMSAFEDDTFEAQLDVAFEQIKPLYEQLHAYVRYKLRKYYGSNFVSEKGAIPIHLLGNMIGQTWNNIADITTPFPDKVILDVTEHMIRQGYTAKKIFEKGDEFFQSLNMTKLPPIFWQKSVLEKRMTRGLCITNMWDFYRKEDVRIHKCTQINMKDLLLVHHELGFIQSYLQYQHQPSVYRDEPRPGFQETIGRVFMLSVSSPKHLEKIGLLKDFVFDEETKLNQLYHSALQQIAAILYTYTFEKYHWEVFRGHIKPENYNCKLWEMRLKYNGVEPPVMRSENDFDATVKYHVSADLKLLHFYGAHIMQFQFHKAACEKAGEYVKGDPEKTLYNCDISQSTAAGNALKEIMAMGASKPWPDIMEAFTGQRKMSADALLEYFQPLYDWLVKENKALGVHVGWESNSKCK